MLGLLPLRQIPECDKALQQAIQSPQTAFALAKEQATYNSWDFTHSASKWPITSVELAEALCLAAKTQGIGVVRQLQTLNILDGSSIPKIFLAAAKHAGPGVLEFALPSLSDTHRIQIAKEGLPFSPLDLFGVLDRLPEEDRPELQVEAARLAMQYRTHARVQDAFCRYRERIEAFDPTLAQELARP